MIGRCPDAVSGIGLLSPIVNDLPFSVFSIIIGATEMIGADSFTKGDVVGDGCLFK